MANATRYAIGIAVLAMMTTAWTSPPVWAGEHERFSDPYSIMAPEPWLAPKYKSPRGLPHRPREPRPTHVPHPVVRTAPPAPPTMLPTGQLIPNLPPVNQGLVPDGGRETFGDRAVRCTHQSSLYGVPAGQQGSYIASCAN